MAQQRLPVRKIREVLRLKAAGFSDRKIAAAIGSARSTVQECVCRARAASLAWPLPPELDEETLQARLYRREVPLSHRPQPDFAQIHAELARPGVTRVLLWQEYKADEPEGWQYSVFCDQYRRWLAGRELVLRQNHAPGEKLFVDYAGQTAAVVDRWQEVRPSSSKWQASIPSHSGCGKWTVCAIAHGAGRLLCCGVRPYPWKEPCVALSLPYAWQSPFRQYSPPTPRRKSRQRLRNPRNNI